MDSATILYLKSLGVSEPVCQNCLSEDFSQFIAYKTQVLWCSHCSAMLNHGKTSLEGFRKTSDNNPESPLRRDNEKELCL